MPADRTRPLPLLAVLLLIVPGSLPAVAQTDAPAPVHVNVVSVEDLGCGVDRWFSHTDLRVTVRAARSVVLDERAHVWPDALGALSPPVQLAPGDRFTVHVREERIGEADAPSTWCDVSPGPGLNRSFTYEGGVRTFTTEGEGEAAVRVELVVGEAPPVRPSVRVEALKARAVSLAWTPRPGDADAATGTDTVRVLGLEARNLTLPPDEGRARIDGLLDNRTHTVVVERALDPWLVADRIEVRTPDAPPLPPTVRWHVQQEGNLSVAWAPATPNDVAGFALYVGQGPDVPLAPGNRWADLDWDDYGRTLRMHAPVLPAFIDRHAPQWYKGELHSGDETHLRIVTVDLAGARSAPLTVDIREDVPPSGGPTLDPRPMGSNDTARTWAAPGSTIPWVSVTDPMVNGSELRPPERIHGVAGGGGQAPDAVQIRIDGGPWHPVEILPVDGRHDEVAWTFSLDPDEHGEGALTVEARAIAGANTSSLASLGIVLTRVSDADPPGRLLDPPGTVHRVNSTVELQGTHGRGVDGPSSYAELRVPGMPGWVRVSDEDPWTYGWDTTGLEPGKHTIEARGFDGEAYTRTVAWTVRLAPEPTSPAPEPEREQASDVRGPEAPADDTSTEPELGIDIDVNETLGSDPVLRAQALRDGELDPRARLGYQVDAGPSLPALGSFELEAGELDPGEHTIEITWLSPQGHRLTSRTVNLTVPDPAPEATSLPSGLVLVIAMAAAMDARRRGSGRV